MGISLADRLARISAPERALANEPMSLHTSFQVGGKADVYFTPASAQEFLEGLRICREEGANTHVIGYGTNLIVRDGGVRGAVISLSERYGKIEREGRDLVAQAGARLSKLASAAQAASLSGLEFAAGIPGGVGGGAAMNAGAYGGQIADILVTAEVLLEGEIRTLRADEMRFGYRTSLPLREGGAVLSARFRLQDGDGEQIAAQMRELGRRRREKQPLEYPSAGSAFKRPEGHFAGALIERAGLKGETVGGARVSEKHAGFLINAGGATATDVLKLIALVQRRVLENSGVFLEPEVRVIGEEAL